MTSHLALPVRFAGSRLAAVDRGSLEEVTQSVRMLLGTRPGERLSIGDYGLPDPTFTPVDGDSIVAAVAAHEPRATVEVGRTVNGATVTSGVTVSLVEG